MKIAVIIPCLNEEAGLPRVLKAIDAVKAAFPGELAVFVVDDGSTDNTAAIARQFNARLLSHPKRRGLSAAFQTGLTAALATEPAVVVNLDGDWQYQAADIPRLVEPVLDGRADVVIGSRNPTRDKNLTVVKRLGHFIGRPIINLLSSVPLNDPISGFRAYAPRAAASINLVNRQSHTIETLFIAHASKFRVIEVPVSTNPPLRPSRLFHNSFLFSLRSGFTALWCLAFYRPILFVFFSLACVGVLSMLISWRLGVGHHGPLQLTLAVAGVLSAGLTAVSRSVGRRSLRRDEQ